MRLNAAVPFGETDTCGGAMICSWSLTVTVSGTLRSVRPGALARSVNGYDPGATFAATEIIATALSDPDDVNVAPMPVAPLSAKVIGPEKFVRAMPSGSGARP